MMSSLDPTAKVDLEFITACTAAMRVCNWCREPLKLVGDAVVALRRCHGCRTISYCEETCQQADWKHHQEECQLIKAGDIVPRPRRATVKIDSKGIIRRVGEPIPTPDPDTIYYSKMRLPHKFDVSIAGPFYPIEKMGEHIETRCLMERSLPALRTLEEISESNGFVHLQHIIAPLLGGEHITFEVVREKNPEVAKFLRSRHSRTNRPVFTIVKEVPHPALKHFKAGNWPFKHAPMLDVKVLKSCLSRKKAHEEAGIILESWNVDMQPGDEVIGGAFDAIFVGQLVGPDETTKQQMRVRVDTGMVDSIRVDD